MNILDFIKDNVLLLDGGMGTELQKKGLVPGEYPETWNLSHPDEIVAVHRAYFEAGSDAVISNTFGANALKFDKSELDTVVREAIGCARRAAEGFSSPKFVALDIGPTGKLLKPLGDLGFEDAVAIFGETVKLGEKYGADFIFIETMNDSAETRAAVIAARENSKLPIFVSNAYGSDEKLMTGASPSAITAILEGLSVDALGANCSLGPDQLSGVIDELLAESSVPVIFKPNAGLPRECCGKTVYDVSPEEFAESVAGAVRRGVRIVGGCCGTTPKHIRLLAEKIKNQKPTEITQKNKTTVASYSHAVTLGGSPVLIGERINPTGKKRLSEAIVNEDIGYIVREGIKQEDCGVHVLDVNVGLPGIDEKSMLCRVVSELQAVTDLPLQLDSSDPSALEAALRVYNGKAMINSVNGKKESMDAVFPLAAKYGGVVVALTLDESGIPSTAAVRVAIAEKILKEAVKYGINKKDVIFDTLAMAVSADAGAPRAALDAIDEIRHRLGCNTVLGVSNISFGLPQRPILNGVFFACALERGLSAAIMNPYSADMMNAYFAFRALHGYDEGCADYIAHSEAVTAADGNSVPTDTHKAKNDAEITLPSAILRGLRRGASALAEKELLSKEPLAVINEGIVPALDEAGRAFEEKRIYLPQLLMCAEAAGEAFDVIKKSMPAGSTGTKNTVVLATVKGDIHDIGKNIVKLLLENYGFRVKDLGRDAPPEAIVDEVLRQKAPVCGLSALMTTTVPAMEETIKQLKEKAPFCRVVVGGAVLTAEYASRIGADHYSPDAMETVRFAEKYCK